MTRAPRSRPNPPKGRATERAVVSQKRAVSAEKRERADAIAELKKFERAQKAIQRGDSWQNAITGLGVAGRDWTVSTTIESDAVLSRQQLDDLYAQDNLAAKIVDTIPEDGIRNWFEIVGVSGGTEADFQKKVFQHCRRLHAKAIFLEWWKFGRKDGGGLILIGADDGQTLDKPLDLERVREIRHLHFVERWMIYPDTIDIDPQSDHFGEPLWYVLLPRGIHGASLTSHEQKVVDRKVGTGLGNTRIHYTRVIPFNGIKVSERRKIMFLGWGYSCLQRPYWSIQNYRVLWAHIATLFKHMAQTIVKFGGYAELGAGDFQKAIKSRLASLQQARSTLSIVPLDANDSLEEQTLRGLSGALEVLRYAQEDLAQGSNMALTKLFGHMPQGFGKDDASGRDNWSAIVSGGQEDHLLEPLRALIQLIAKAYNIAEPEDWEIDFLPITVPDGEVASKIDLEEAQADDYRIANGTIDPEEARNSIRANPKSRYQLEEGAAKGDLIAHPPPVPVVAPGAVGAPKTGAPAPAKKAAPPGAGDGA